MTEEERSGSGTETRRRSVLGALGSAVAVGPLVRTARAATPAQTLILYLHVHEGCTGDDVSCATGAATRLVRQFNDRFDDYRLSWTFGAESAWESDRDHLETEWEQIPENGADGYGIHAFLLRDAWRFDNGYGHRIERVRGDGDGAAVANVGAARFWDGDRVAANLVVHEVLHAMDAVHADGEVSYVPGDRGADGVYANVSPMATAYVRYVGRGCDDPFRDTCSDTAWPGSGTVPDAFSDGTDNRSRAAAVGSHTAVVADAAWNSVRAWLDGI